MQVLQIDRAGRIQRPTAPQLLQRLPLRPQDRLVAAQGELAATASGCKFRAKLADFGRGETQQEMSAKGCYHESGTLTHMAPELDEGELGCLAMEGTTVFAMGVLLHELYIGRGRTAFTGTS